MKLIRVGVDLAKNVFQVHGVDRNEKPVWRRRLTRDHWLQVVLETVEPGCQIGMEACGGAHYWARKLQERGFTVKLIAPQFVKPYVQSNKNDANDAEAICEAMSRPKMRFVAVKTLEQQDIQAVHRIRSGLIEQRTAKGNQIRGLISEYGLVAPRELVQLRRALPVWLEDAGNGLSERFRRLLNALWCDLQLLDERVAELDREIALIAHSDLPPDGCNSFVESGRSLPRRWWPRWVTARSLPMAGRWRHRWGSPPNSTARVAKTGCLGSASEATRT
jgi:transposase